MPWRGCRRPVESTNGLARAYMENMKIWQGLFVKTRRWLSVLYKFPERSSILFDTVAAMIALEDPIEEPIGYTNVPSTHFVLKPVLLLVTDDAYTLVADDLLNQKDYVQKTFSHEVPKEQVAQWKAQAQELVTNQRTGKTSSVVYVTVGWKKGAYPDFLQKVSQGISGCKKDVVSSVTRLATGTPLRKKTTQKIQLLDAMEYMLNHCSMTPVERN